MSTTRPEATARIGVPDGTPMSIPGWQDSHERTSQNGDVIGPLTGHTMPPLPCWIGPAGSVPDAPSPAATRARRAWMRA